MDDVDNGAAGDAVTLKEGGDGGPGFNNVASCEFSVGVPGVVLDRLYRNHWEGS